MAKVTRRKKVFDWLLLAFILIGPYIFIPVFEKQWATRLFFIGAFIIYGEFLFFSEIVNKITLFSKLYRILGETGGKWFLLGIKGMLFFLSILAWLIFLGQPLLNDYKWVRSNEGQFATGTATITMIRNYPFQILSFSEESQFGETSFKVYYFPTRYFTEGNMYEFKYLPNSKLVLEAKLVQRGK